VSDRLKYVLIEENWIYDTVEYFKSKNA